LYARKEGTDGFEKEEPDMGAAPEIDELIVIALAVWAWAFSLRGVRA
jgi:hypothetical protein